MPDKKRKKIPIGFINTLIIFVIVSLPVPVILLEVFVGIEFLSCIALLFYSFRKYSVRMPSYVFKISHYILAINTSLTRVLLMNHEKIPLVTFIANIMTQNNYIVGIIIILILLCVLMILVSKESTKFSEIAKRYSLDTMNQNFFAIDTGLNYNRLSQKEAEDMKQEVRNEIDFYSMMEGMSLLVLGNAKSVIFMTVLNIIGGLRSEKLLLNKPWLESFESTSIYTTGNVLIYVIPIIIVSVAMEICMRKNSET